MGKEQIDKLFNELLWRMNSIQTVNSQMEIKLKIAFQEGIIKASEFFIKKFSPQDTL